MNEQYRTGQLREFLEWRAGVMREDVTYLGALEQPARNDLVGRGACIYERHVERFPKEMWQPLWQMGAGILDPNPFGASPTRPGGMRVWDSLVTLPRDPSLTPIDTFRGVAARRHCNSVWLEKVEPAIRRTGPVQGMPQRPEHPWVFDLRANPNGWFLLEAAHVLTHLRLDSAEHARLDPIRDYNPYPAVFQRTVAEIVLGIRLGGPVDVSQGTKNQRKQ